MIKLIALDLDGTTLRNNGELTIRNRITFESVIAKGVQIVIATGRVLSALPEDMLKIRGIQYCITSNGASIVDLASTKQIYTNYISEPAVTDLIEKLKKYNFMIEAFIGGQAYVEQDVYEDVQINGSIFNNAKYLLTTRKPVKNLLNYILQNKGFIENININFERQDQRNMVEDALMSINNILITSSLDHNLEIGDIRTTKAEALKELCSGLGISTSEVMACGDSYNDVDMLRAAGLPIAVGNAKDEVKAVAKYIVPTNEEDGVSEAIRRFIL